VLPPSSGVKSRHAEAGGKLRKVVSCLAYSSPPEDGGELFAQIFYCLHTVLLGLPFPPEDGGDLLAQMFYCLHTTWNHSGED
jgi:predicted 2-oxoglutarate/Fe(II)-dependent dioxygenase YbiX